MHRVLKKMTRVVELQAENTVTAWLDKNNAVGRKGGSEVEATRAAPL